MKPKVSILWVNHNSSDFIDLTIESLRAVKDLDYPDYELILVDNGSADGSFAIIEDFLAKARLDCKVIRLERNLGFTGANNTAYAARSRNSRYVAILNNDAIPRQESLRQLVDFMENDETLGAVQGVILNLDERSIDTAGDYLSELLQATSLFQGNDPRSMKKPVYATSADAAYSVFRVKAIDKIVDQNGHLFNDYLFGYFDDHTLGLKLWNSGSKVKAFPIITAKHRRGSSFGKLRPLQAYLHTRNLLILNEISNSRYRNLIKLLYLRQLSTWFLHKIVNLSTEQGARHVAALISKAFADGIRIGRARRHFGEKINIYKAPILEVQPSTAFLGTIISLHFIGSTLERELDNIGTR